MKAIGFAPNVPAQIRAIDQKTALGILRAISRYAETGEGNIKPLSGEFEGAFRLRVGRYRVIFEEAPDAVTILRVRVRRDAYRT